MSKPVWFCFFNHGHLTYECSLPAYPLLSDYPKIVPEIKTPGMVVIKKTLSLQCRFPVVNDSRVQYDVRWYFGVDLKLKYSEKVIVDPLVVSEAHSSLQPDVHKDAGISDDDMQNVGVVFTALAYLA